MEGMMINTGAGVAAIGFWLFLAAIVVAGMWYDIRKRESQQRTLRSILESGQQIDEELIDKLLSAGSGGRAQLARELMVWGIVVLSIAPGLAVLGWFIALQYAPALYPVLGAAALVGFIGIGLVVAARIAGRGGDAA